METSSITINSDFFKTYNVKSHNLNYVGCVKSEGVKANWELSKSFASDLNFSDAGRGTLE